MVSVGLPGMETGEGGGLGKKDSSVLMSSGWFVSCGETTITSLGCELVPNEKQILATVHLFKTTAKWPNSFN